MMQWQVTNPYLEEIGTMSKRFEDVCYLAWIDPNGMGVLEVERRGTYYKAWVCGSIKEAMHRAEQIEDGIIDVGLSKEETT